MHGSFFRFCRFQAAAAEYIKNKIGPFWPWMITVKNEIMGGHGIKNNNYAPNFISKSNTLNEIVCSQYGVSSLLILNLNKE